MENSAGATLIALAAATLLSAGCSRDVALPPCDKSCTYEVEDAPTVVVWGDAYAIHQVDEVHTVTSDANGVLTALDALRKEQRRVMDVGEQTLFLRCDAAADLEAVRALLESESGARYKAIALAGDGKGRVSFATFRLSRGETKAPGSIVTMPLKTGTCGALMEKIEAEVAAGKMVGLSL